MNINFPNNDSTTSTYEERLDVFNTRFKKMKSKNEGINNVFSFVYEAIAQDARLEKIQNYLNRRQIRNATPKAAPSLTPKMRIKI